MTFQIFSTLKWAFHGYRNYTKGGYENASKSFENIKDIKFDNLSVMITGANSGIGFQLAKDLIQYSNITLHLVCRNEQRGKDAVEAIQNIAAENSKVLLHILDLGNLDEIKKFLSQPQPKINVLINNAGILATEFKLAPGTYLEESYVINIVGLFKFTEGMLAFIEKPICYKYPRVITVTSGGALTQVLNSKDPALKKTYENNFDGKDMYSQEKRQQITLTEHWAKKYPEIQFFTMHPGWVDTPGVEKSLPLFYKYMKNKLRTPEQGSDTLVYLTINPEVEMIQPSGAMFFDRKKVDKFITSKPEDYKDQRKEFIENLEKMVSNL